MKKLIILFLFIIGCSETEEKITDEQVTMKDWLLEQELFYVNITYTTGADKYYYWKFSISGHSGNGGKFFETYEFRDNTPPPTDCKNYYLEDRPYEILRNDDKVLSVQFTGTNERNEFHFQEDDTDTSSDYTKKIKILKYINNNLEETVDFIHIAPNFARDWFEGNGIKGYLKNFPSC